MAEPPVTYEKNFRVAVALKFTSSLSLEAVTSEAVLQQVKRSLDHSDTLMDVTVTRVEEMPDRLGELVIRLTELQVALDCLRRELGVG